ncbi:hypothetical protein OKW76_04245 [Sphingomonas sp. S1-29]|uniref:hypothetical protein n=1 Tax=Sphingomonas sp. S1-29 TaxID=2991074 RepID=UPI002240A61B|nr:hypothetical protein [Sphingomonas sp. S1-29]UZK70265.1 hypothetical protein OKW76_04245 [Sphingomonas sp. S1-29]
MHVQHPFRAGEPGYRLQEINHCPGCGGSQWLVGRVTAECATCATALPIRTGQVQGDSVFRVSNGSRPARLAA